MSDPQRQPDDHPRRAEPVQPDKPGSGRSAEATGDHATRRESLKKAEQQEGTAVDNARDGYR